MIRTLVRMGPRGWRDLIEAQYWILHARRQLRNVPLGTLVARSAEVGEGVPGTGPKRGESDPPLRGAALDPGLEVESGHGRDPLAERLALAIDRIGRRGFGRPLCLARSVALSHLLRSRGIPGGRIVIGVRGGGTTLEAHAWVEVRGVPVGRDSAIAPSFIRLDEIAVFPHDAIPDARTGRGGDPR